MSDPVGHVSELRSYRGSTLRDGTPSKRRGFRVVGMNMDVAINQPGIPQYRDEHPDFPGLLAANRTATHMGRDTHVVWEYVEAPYVGGSIPPVNQFAEDFIGKDVSFETKQYSIPLMRAAEITVGEGESAVTKTVFEKFEDSLAIDVPVPYHRIPLGFTLPESATLEDSINVTKIITAQVGKVHTIFGEDFLFTCEGIDQNGLRDYNVVYRWTADPGLVNELETQFGPSAGPNLRYIGSTIYPVFNADFLVPPFQALRIDGNQDPEQPPIVTFFNKNKREPDGWQLLPGIA